jgi:hypothetical protein
MNAASEAERGSAVAEMVLLIVPILFLPLATISVTLNAYLRLVLTDVAIEGARTAALADQTLEDGVVRAKSLLTGALGREVNPTVMISRSQNSQGLAVVKIMLQIEKPIAMAVTTHALAETQR